MVGSVETLRHVREKRAKPLVSTISRLRDLPDSVRLNLRSCYTLGASKSSRRHGVFKAPRPVGTAFWFDEGPRYGSTFVSNTPWHCWKTCSTTPDGDGLRASPGIINGETLAELARKHQVAEAVINRLSNFMDAERCARSPTA